LDIFEPNRIHRIELRDLAKYSKSPSQGRFGDRQPAMLTEQFLQGLFLKEGFVDLRNGIGIEVIRDIDSVELEDFDPFCQFGEFEFGSRIEEVGGHPNALESFAPESLADKSDAFVEALVDFGDGSRVLDRKRLESFLGQPIGLLHLFANFLGYGHVKFKLKFGSI
jgi:hypothetical protein